MLGLGLASSHDPAIFCPPEAWPIVYDAIPDYMKDSQPHTARLETPEVIRAQLARTDKAFEALRAYRGSVLDLIPRHEFARDPTGCANLLGAMSRTDPTPRGASSTT